MFYVCAVDNVKCMTDVCFRSYVMASPPFPYQRKNIVVTVVILFSMFCKWCLIKLWTSGASCSHSLRLVLMRGAGSHR